MVLGWFLILTSLFRIQINYSNDLCAQYLAISTTFCSAIHKLLGEHMAVSPDCQVYHILYFFRGLSCSVWFYVPLLVLTGVTPVLIRFNVSQICQSKSIAHNQRKSSLTTAKSPNVIVGISVFVLRYLLWSWHGFKV